MADGAFSNCSGNRDQGAPGDTTKTEYYLRSWYDGPWSYRARHPNQAIRALISALAVQAAQNDNIGYNMNSRDTFRTEVAKVGYMPSKIQVKCAADCSSSTACIVWCAGHLSGDQKLQAVPSFATGDSGEIEYAALQAAGFEITSSGISQASAVPGDIYWNGHHSTIWTDGNPDAGSVDASVYGSLGSASGYYAGEFYTTKNTRNDAIIREVSYLDQDLKPSIEKTDLRFSVLNYTVFVGGIWKAFCNKYGYTLVSSMGAGGNDMVDIDSIAPGEVNVKVQQIIEYMMVKWNWSLAAACGLCGNIAQESEFDAAVVGGPAHGLCQWQGSRWTHLQQYAASRGQSWTNWQLQLDFIFEEKDETPNHMNTFPNTAQGAYDAADWWCWNWERPYEYEANIGYRRSEAVKYFKTYVQLINH